MWGIPARRMHVGHGKRIEGSLERIHPRQTAPVGIPAITTYTGVLLRAQRRHPAACNSRPAPSIACSSWLAPSPIWPNRRPSPRRISPRRCNIGHGWRWDSKRKTLKGSPSCWHVMEEAW